ncbi:ergosterol biosynthesis ERG4/ERG24 family-domain-containing protein [Crepidotus variabilis]|uniref:Ergosterol biosynthesis ERG4/ERG24 family-domain-containing protein n=1 Tax=Crepidotus variabilis TaxID=179855 RepID=A0A9P6EJ37_9AGAR|nr:ergosterol biosynthesis ERG4/ERG24 family-domain-containing protein [Crepidotus variabilis]
MKLRAAKAELNPKTLRYDFHGPIGALLTALGVPCVAFVLYFFFLGTFRWLSSCYLSRRCLPNFTKFRMVGGLWDAQCFLTFLAWYVFCLVGWLILPGQWVSGSKLRNGSHQVYKLNGFYTYLLVLSICASAVQPSGALAFTLIRLNQKWPQYITAGIALAFIESLYCYAISFERGTLLSLGGNSGNIIYDNVTNSIWLLVAFQLYYIGDALYNEVYIVHEGLGFMLAIGHFVLVPFTFSLQARYLVFQPQDLSLFWIIIVTILNFVGYHIYRISNAEKHAFRIGKIPKTKVGSRLPISGWWSWSRHSMAIYFAWCFTTGFKSPIPYFYAAFLTGLLTSRQQRDEEICTAK